MRPAIYFWQPVLTDHAIFTYRALAESLDMAALCLCDQAELGARRAQSWEPAKPVLPIEVLDAAGWRQRLESLVARGSADIHVFSGAFRPSRINAAFKLALARGHRVFVVSESYAPIATSYFGAKVTLGDRLKAWLRPLLYRWYGRRYGARICGLFAISPLAVRQFAAIGVPRGRIFPFGYFVPAQADCVPAPEAPAAAGPLRAAFVGALIERKGIDTAIAAFRLLGSGPLARLDIYGPGDPAGLGELADNVRYAGKIEFGQTQQVLTGYDALIVPSRHDGWAVVVNEAVLAGIAVIASVETGASAMIEKWQCGARFPAGDAAALAGCIAGLARDAASLKQAKQQSRRLAQQITPQMAGGYMAECIRAASAQSEPPPCPWYP